MNLSQIPTLEFSKYCERKVAIEFMQRGWNVFEPVVDRYIDLVVSKNFCETDNCIEWNSNNPKCEQCGNTKFIKIIRTIQVKGSRLEKGGLKPSFAINHRPKDLLPDEKHFFVWLFHESSKKENFMMIRPNQFTQLEGSGVQTQTWLDHTHRYHINKNSLNDSKFCLFLNNWDALHTKFNDNPIKDILENTKNSHKKWKSETTPTVWTTSSKKLVKILEKRLEKKAIEDIINTKSKVFKFKKLKQEKYRNTSPKITSTVEKNPIEALAQNLEDDFTFIQNDWRVYNEKMDPKKRLLLKIRCSSCKYPWPVDEKECYICKSWSPPVVYCNICKTCQPEENKQNCPVCKINNKKKILKFTKCPNCKNTLDKFDKLHKSNPKNGKRKSCPECKAKFKLAKPNKICPKCKEDMRKLATKCPHCKKDFVVNVKIEKTCFVCNEKRSKYEFQPITFCQKCGERKSEFVVKSI